MPNGTANCILLVCCDPESERPVEMLAGDLVAYGVDRADAKKCATYILEHYDLAEKGTLQAFKDSIAKLAREDPHDA